jgi:hypothetical protein
MRPTSSTFTGWFLSSVLRSPGGQDGGGHRPEMPLAGEQLAECVADVDHADLPGVDRRGRERPVDHLPGQVGEVLALTVQVPREVRLVAAEHPDVRLSHPTQLPPCSRGAGRPALATAVKLHYN